MARGGACARLWQGRDTEGDCRSQGLQQGREETHGGGTGAMMGHCPYSGPRRPCPSGSATTKPGCGGFEGLLSSCLPRKESDSPIIMGQLRGGGGGGGGENGVQEWGDLGREEVTASLQAPASPGGPRGI